jgi:hypothetical protein
LIWSFIFLYPTLVICLCNCRCLDSILHAEHKGILEEMRTDYSCARSMGKGETINEEFITNGKKSEYARHDINGVGSVERYEEEDNELDKPMSFINGLDLRNLLGSLDKNVKKYSDGGSRFVTICLDCFLVVLN